MPRTKWLTVLLCRCYYQALSQRPCQCCGILFGWLQTCNTRGARSVLVGSVSCGLKRDWGFWTRTNHTRYTQAPLFPTLLIFSCPREWNSLPLLFIIMLRWTFPVPSFSSSRCQRTSTWIHVTRPRQLSCPNSWPVRSRGISYIRSIILENTHTHTHTSINLSTTHGSPWQLKVAIVRRYGCWPNAILPLNIPVWVCCCSAL